MIWHFLRKYVYYILFENYFKSSKGWHDNMQMDAEVNYFVHTQYDVI